MIKIKEKKFQYNAFFKNALNTLHDSGNYRHFLDIERNAQTYPKFTYTDHHGNKKQATNWCSNDYLAQSTNPIVISALQQAAAQSGTGSGGTRNISGTTTYHKKLELLTAQLVKKESALIFNSAYLANQTALTTLGRHLKNCVFISDQENHASIIEGIRATKCDRHIFQHNNLNHLEAILCQLPSEVPKILVFESVYSMSGSIAPIKEICQLAKKYNCLTYCDEVHAVGLYGNGHGLVAQEECSQAVDIINGTYAKAFGVIGGFVAATATLVDFIRSHAEGFIFTTSLPPATCAAICASIEYVLQTPTLLETFHKNVQQLHTILSKHGVQFEATASHITRINIGDSKKCKLIANRLLQEFGVYLQPIVPPTVPKGEACLRIIVGARHSEEDMEHFAKALNNNL
jgi:5-aminolevulinate synthase